MIDPAHKATEKILKEIEARLDKEYKKASEEVAEKLRDYLDRYRKKDEIWRKWVEEAEGTPEHKQRLKEYQEWRVGQIAIGKRWENMKTQLAEDYHHTNDIAKSIVYGYMPDVYALNFNFGTYTVEKGARLDTSFTLYSRATVERLMRDDPKLLPDPGKKTAARIAAGKDVLWNKQQIQSVMMQGILQGKSIPALATDLSKTVGDKNRKAAIRNARTMTTGAQNAGRVDSYTRAQEMGIQNEKQWLATLDGRTRHSHRMLDGETVPLKNAFSNGCEYPGDPNGDPSEVYNCRCTLLTVIKGHGINVKDLSLRRNNKLEGMSYEEWKKGKAESNPITLPEEKGEAIKQAYNAEYRRKAGEIGGGGTTKTQPEQPVKNPAEKTTEALANAYEYHRTKNNLNVVPYEELKRENLDIISAEYKNLSKETADAFNNTITRLINEYDTPLQKIRSMTKEESIGNSAFASVAHDYSFDNALMVINPVKCKDAEKLANRIKELSARGYAIKIQEGKELEYVPTHEFAHTLLNMSDPLVNKTNWVGADYKKIKEVRKEIKWIYDNYKFELKELENRAKNLELEFLTTFDVEKGEKARELYLKIEKIKLSDYSLNNVDEFLAEAFTHAKIGKGENEYSAQVMEILDKYFKR